MRVSVNGVLYDILPTDRKLDTVTPPEVWKEWSEITMPSSRSFDGICYGEGKFVGIGYNSTDAAYSEDGINWQTATLPINKYWQDLAYGDGKFVGIAYDSNEGVYSEDGINWVKTTLSGTTSRKWISIAYGAGHFIAVPNDSSGKYACFYRDNTWKEFDCPSGMAFSRITYGDGKFVALNRSSTVISYSEDGFNWSSVSDSIPTSHSWINIVYGNGKYVATFSDVYGNGLIYSEDGINWQQIFAPSSITTTWGHVGYGDGVFVIPVHKSDAIAYSFDAIEWNVAYVLPGYSDYWSNICYGAGRFIVTTSGGSSMQAISPIKKVKSLITE